MSKKLLIFLFSSTALHDALYFLDYIVFMTSLHLSSSRIVRRTIRNEATSVV